ncbi:hypothetical protein M3Y97_00708000 [Aphelenchoides bicaudatus]|nr:hypothetical protein M3Y97_00708000 [Aphelenchoides bicaudatus]
MCSLKLTNALVFIFACLEMSIESRVENFFRGLVSQTGPKRSKSTVNGVPEAEDSDQNGAQRGRKDSMKKVKARSTSKKRTVPVTTQSVKSSAQELEHVDDFPDLPHDNSIIFARQNSGRKKRAVPISTTTTPDSVLQSPQWSDRFRQLRRSIQGRAMKNSVSPQPAEKAPDFSDLPPKPTPRQRSKSVVKQQSQSPYEDSASPPIHRMTLTVEAHKESDLEQPDEKTDSNDSSAQQKRQKFRRSRSVTTSESQKPITTHFPISGEPVTTKNGDFDAYGGYILSDADQKSSHAESGYLSALELSIPRSASAWSQTSPNIDHTALPPRPPSRGTIFDRQASIRSKSRATTPEPTRRERLSSARSESNLRRLERSNSVGWALDALRERVQETKYVTAVFESAKGGISPILTDILKELGHWLGPKSRLLAVACEVHWSVPESVRSRAVEIRMKDELHRVLRQNNKRVLQLYDERQGSFPLSLIESKTEESCARDSTLDAFQGIYRRYYPELLSLQDAQTEGTDVKSSLNPSPARFLFRPNRSILAKKSVVALNMAVLRMVGDDSDYERTSMSSSMVNVVVQSKIARSNRASRLLRIEVQDIDDNQPVFAPHSPVG